MSNLRWGKGPVGRGHPTTPGPDQAVMTEIRATSKKEFVGGGVPDAPDGPILLLAIAQ